MQGEDDELPLFKNWESREYEADLEASQYPDIIKADEERFRRLCKRYNFEMPDVLDTFVEKIDRGEIIKRCRTCVHRERHILNERSQRVIQCCELQRSIWSNSDYKIIKATNRACSMYEPINKAKP